MSGVQITLSWETLIAVAGGLAALTALLGTLFKGYDFVRRQQRQDLLLRAIKAEQQILTLGVLACLKGLKEQGCNGPVTEAIQKIEKHLNARAHEQN